MALIMAWGERCRSILLRNVLVGKDASGNSIPLPELA